MKTLTKKMQSQINAYIDNELDEKKRYEISKFIENNKIAKEFYEEMISLKSRTDFNINVKASPNFEERLFEKIHSQNVKKNRFSVIQRFFDMITIERLSYAGAALVFLVVFGFAVLNISKKTMNTQPTVRNESEANTSSDIPPVTPSSNIARTNAQPKSPSRTQERNSTTAQRQGGNTDNSNQVRTRQLFNQLESRRTETALKKNLNKGIKEFYKRNFFESRKHFRRVLKQARPNSVMFLQARDYLQRMQNR